MVVLLSATAKRTFQSPVSFATGMNPTSVAILTLNGDPNANLVVANEDSNTVSVLLGNGNGTFQSQETFSVGTGPVSVTVAEVTRGRQFRLDCPQSKQ